jgi:micrococcal nuclease
MFPRTRIFKIYIFPFLVIGLILLSEWLKTEYGKQQTFQEKAKTTNALAEVDVRHLTQATVRKVVDGDTIELEDGQKVRYIGMDTPETKHPKKSVQCYGREASAKNKELVEGKQILMEKDVSETDRYGRLLRYIYLPNPKASDEAIFVNEYLVEQGYARLLTYPPDIKYNEILQAAEKTARKQNKGLWSSCKN